MSDTRSRRSHAPLPVGLAILAALVAVAASPGFGRSPAGADHLAAEAFTPQVRLGFTTGNQWEPSIAADQLGHVYVFYAQYLGVPGCLACYSPTGILQVSADGGASWVSPAILYADGATRGQWDPQIVVDSVDGSTVYASWLQNGKSDVMVGRSHDFGTTWEAVVADHVRPGLDKPILAVHGSDVYVAYNHAQKIWVSASHDGGASFEQVAVNKGGKLGWSLASGGVVDGDGNVYFAWAGYEQNGSAKGPVNLFLSRSTDDGATWSNTVVDVSRAPPDCSAYFCGWAYLGAQMAVAVDASGELYVLWNASSVDHAPARMYLARSSDGGVTWSPRAEVSLAPLGADHSFPAIAAGESGDVRIAWMDNRASGLWNTYFRRSTDGGANWSPESDLSTYVPGFSYIHPEGFSFPFGDYFEMDLGRNGATHIVWGEGLNYDSPGSIWYATDRQ